MTVVPTELQARLSDSTTDDLFLSNWASVSGTLYKKDCGLVLEGKDDIPVFGKLLDIYVHDHTLYFHINILETLEYNSHFHCFVVKKSHTDKIIIASDLSVHIPHHIRLLPGQRGKHCIVPCYHFHL